MTKFEIITLFASSLAVLATIVSIYFQFFRKRTRALLRLIQIDHSEGTMNFCYAFSNSGNQNLLIRAIKFIQDFSDKGKNEDTPPSEYYCACDKNKSVIKPGEISLINVIIKSDDLEKTKSKQNFYISFEVVSPTGKSQVFLHDITNIFSYESDSSAFNLYRINKFKN